MNFLCGCYYHVASTEYHIRIQKHYLPLIDSTIHSTILSTTSRTVLKQKFTNPSSTEAIKECIYTFPLYDGVSVVSFTCRIGKRVLRGLVKENVKAKQIFDDAVSKGETAGLLEQAPEASDVFSTKLGNIPAGQSVIVEITYIGELKHHETDGIRFTIPTKIAPRYGTGPKTGLALQAQDGAGIKITVDVNMPEGSFIKAVQSPSHPIAVSMGTVSTASTADPLMSRASATLSLGTTGLEKDFILIVQSKDVGVPKAILETHPTIRDHRALMATLVPKFSLPPARPEIVFVADRSGSMQDNMTMLISAMNVFLKSVPVGVKFNICSFGSSCSFLWAKSQSYNQETLQQANDHLLSFQANMGGTETFGAIQATIERRYADIPLEIILLTDGDIWRQDDLFQYINQQVEQTNGNIRIFPLGIGNGVSHALIEGLARAGNGFAQAVQIGERLENCIVRMLRGALSPHITDYTLEVKYERANDDFELVDKVNEGMQILLSDDGKAASATEEKPTISLFDKGADPEKEQLKGLNDSQFWLPDVPYPKLHQAPHKIPTLFPFSRTSVYLLMSPETIQQNPTAVILRATSSHGPLALEIPIEALPIPAETIHQLAAKKAVQDLEEGRGWIYDAKDQNGTLVKDRYPSCFDDLVQREAVRLGEKFQIAGKWCSFVAVAANDKEIAEKENKEIEQKSLVTDEDGDIYADEDMGVHEDFASFGSDDDDGYTMIGGSSVPAPPYQPVPRSVNNHLKAHRVKRKTENVVDGNNARRSSSSFAARHLPNTLARAGPVNSNSTVFGNFANTTPQSPNAARTSYNPLSSLQPAQTPQNAFGSRATFHYSNLKSSGASNEKVLVPQAQPTRYNSGTIPLGFGSQQPALSDSSSGVAEGTSSSLFGSAFGQPQTQNLDSPKPIGQAPFDNLRTRSQGRIIPTRESTSPRTTSMSPGLLSSYSSQSQASLFRPAAQPDLKQDDESRAAPSISHGPGNLFDGRQLASSTYGTSESMGLVVSDLTLAQASAPQLGERSRKTQHQTPPLPPPPAGPVCSPSRGAFRGGLSPQSRVRAKAGGLASSLSASLRRRGSAPDRKEWAGKSIAEKVLAIIALQTFEGSWPPTNDELFKIMGLAKRDVEKGDVERNIWITILVVRWLEVLGSEEEGTWGLVVEKARAWLEGLGVELNGLEKDAGLVVEKLKVEGLEEDGDW